MSDTKIVRGGQVRYVEVSDTSSTCRQHLNPRVRSGTLGHPNDPLAPMLFRMIVGQLFLKLYYPNESDALAAVDALLAKSLDAEAVRTPLGGWAAAVHVEAADDDLDRVRAEIDAIVRPLPTCV